MRKPVATFHAPEVQQNVRSVDGDAVDLEDLVDVVDLVAASFSET